MKAYRLVCPCLLGVEGLVADELREMGAENVAPENGRVVFDGSPEMIARANIRSRFSERVLVLLGTFEAKSFDALFRAVTALPWADWIGRDDAFPVKGRCLSSTLMSVPDCQSIIKKAVVESLKARYRLERFPETGPLYQIQFLIMKDKVSIMLDTSGAGLHKRGYRKHANEAPIKETLAAALAKLSRVRTDGTLIDPFCGSGTVLIESALLAMHIAPGLRRHFAAEKWRAVPGYIWEQERQAAKALERRNEGFRAFGYDIDPAAVALTLENAGKAGVADVVTAAVRDIADFDGSGTYGCVICNPPYGERLLDVKSAEEIYRVMGRVFTPRRGWSYAVISPDEQFETCFGRKADKKRKLYNGMIRCNYYMYYKS
ncbi:MAG: class I SAM-dependent RNA methyltransferase [Hominenteromicrobium sp.]